MSLVRAALRGARGRPPIRRRRLPQTDAVAHDSKDQPKPPASEEEKRRLALAIMASSVAPLIPEWMFPKQPWRQLSRQSAALPWLPRLATYVAFAFSVVSAASSLWAIVTGRGRLAAYALLASLGLSFVTLPISLAALAIRRRRLSRRE